MAIKKLTKKRLSELKKYASASIIEGEDGSYSVSTQDTAAIYLTILSLNKNNVNIIEDITPSDYGIINQGEFFYSFETSMFNTFIEKSKVHNFFFANNIKQGQAGNISLSYLSYSRNKKLINKDMYNIIIKSKIKFVVEDRVDSHNTFLVNIDSLSDWDIFLNDSMKIYKPVRFFIEYVSPNECNNFYLKKINAYFNKVYKDITNELAKKEDLKLVKSKVIREEYGFNISNYINGVSNNNFLIKVIDGKLVNIYLIEPTFLYFPYEQNTTHNFDRDSFIKREYDIFKDNELFVNINPLELYNNSDIDTKAYFVRNESIIIEKINESNSKTSRDILINKSDEKIYNKLKDLKGNIFEVSPIKGENNVKVIIKPKKDSNILVSLYERNHNRYSNIGNQIYWFKPYSSSLSFEREKILSVFYIESLVSKLVEEGHTNINISLERPTPKKSGGYGFLDLTITSNFNGFNYGQIIEFKAIYDFNNNVKEKCQNQCDNYDITKIINEGNINESYGEKDCSYVELINLIDYYY
jgi:hypothetical protein